MNKRRMRWRGWERRRGEEWGRLGGEDEDGRGGGRRGGGEERRGGEERGEERRGKEEYESQDMSYILA